MSAPAPSPEQLQAFEAASLAALRLESDSVLVRQPDWVEVTTPSSRAPWLNSVLHSSVPEAELEATIDRVLARYQALGVPFRWCVGPLTRPADLGQRLLARGLRLTSDALGMVARVDRLDLPRTPALPVERVDAASLPDYVAVFGAGWGMAPAACAQLELDLRRRLRAGAEATLLFLSRVEGAPAGAGALELVPGGGWLMGSVVLPELRRRGVYRALLAARAEALRTRGLASAYVEANRATSAPICARLGFEVVCERQRYEWHPA